MGISVTTSPQQITAAVGESKIDVSVSGGFGPSGAAGSNGQAATVAVGTVTTGAAGSQAAVTNVGSSSAAVLNFTIPAGATGATGPQGPAGAAGASAWGDITGKPSTFTPSSHTHDYVEVAGSSTYTNFLTTAGNLGGALSEIDGELTARALAADFDQGLKTTSEPTFAGLTVNGFVATKSAVNMQTATGGFGSGFVFNADAGVLIFPDGSQQTAAYTGKIGTTSGLVLKTGTDGVIAALAQGTAGQVLWVNAGATAAEWHSLTPSDIGASSLGHAHGASDVTSGTFDIARIPTGTTSTTVSLGNHTHAVTALTAGTWKVFYSNGSSVVELALGASGTVLQSNGTASAPSFAAVSGESFHPFLLAGM